MKHVTVLRSLARDLMLYDKTRIHPVGSDKLIYRNNFYTLSSIVKVADNKFKLTLF